MKSLGMDCIGSLPIYPLVTMIASKIAKRILVNVPTRKYSANIRSLALANRMIDFAVNMKAMAPS